MVDTWRRPRKLIRTALGPGVQAYGPTEQLLRTIACPSSSSDEPPNRYCEQRASTTMIELHDRRQMARR